MTSFTNMNLGQVTCIVASIAARSVSIAIGVKADSTASNSNHCAFLLAACDRQGMSAPHCKRHTVYDEDCVDCQDLMRRKRERELPSSTGSAARRLHLINAIRVWLNRAITHAENDNVKAAESAVRSAREVLATLETLCRLNSDPAVRILPMQRRAVNPKAQQDNQHED